MTKKIIFTRIIILAVVAGVIAVPAAHLSWGVIESGVAFLAAALLLMWVAIPSKH